MAIFTKSKQEGDKHRQGLVQKTPTKSNNHGSKGMPLSSSEILNSGGAVGTGGSATRSGKKKTLRGLNKLAFRFRKLDEDTVDSFDDSQNGEGYIPPPPGIGGKFVDVYNSHSSSHSSDTSKSTLDGKHPRKGNHAPISENTTPSRSNARSLLPKIPSSQNKRYQNVEAAMRFQRLDTFDSYDSEAVKYNLAHDSFASPAKNHRQLQKETQTPMRHHQFRKQQEQTLISHTVFLTPQPEKHCARSTNRSKKIASDAEIIKKDLSTSEQKSNYKGVPLSQNVLMNDDGTVCEIPHPQQRLPTVGSGKGTKGQLHTRTPGKMKKQEFKRLSSECGSYTPHATRLLKSSSKKSESKKTVKRNVKDIEDVDDGFDIRSTTQSDHRQVDVNVGIQKSPFLLSDTIVDTKNLLHCNDDGDENSNAGYPSEDGAEEFQQFVFDQNFNSIKAVATAKSDHGSNDFSDFVSAANKLTQKFTRDLNKDLSSDWRSSTRNHNQIDTSTHSNKLNDWFHLNTKLVGGSNDTNGSHDQINSHEWDTQLVKVTSTHSSVPFDEMLHAEESSLYKTKQQPLVDTFNTIMDTTRHTTYKTTNHVSEVNSVDRNQTTTVALDDNRMWTSNHETTGNNLNQTHGNKSVKGFKYSSNQSTATFASSDSVQDTSTFFSKFTTTQAPYMSWETDGKDESTMCNKSEWDHNENAGSTGNFSIDEIEEIDPFTQLRNEPFTRDTSNIIEDVDPFGIGSSDFGATDNAAWKFNDTAWNIPTQDPFNKNQSDKSNQKTISKSALQKLDNVNEKQVVQHKKYTMPKKSEKHPKTSKPEREMMQGFDTMNQDVTSTIFRSNDNLVAPSTVNQPRRREMSNYVKQNFDRLIGPQPSLKSTVTFDSIEESVDEDNDDDIPIPDKVSNKKRSSIGPQKIAPKAVPTNAILGSMLFRQTQTSCDVPENTKPTTHRIKNKLSAYGGGQSQDQNGPGHYDDSNNYYRSCRVPHAVVTDGTESIVSSVTEEASSVYKKFQPAWTKQAQSLVNTYQARKAAGNVGVGAGVTLNDRVNQMTEKMSRLEREHTYLFTSEF